MASGIARTAHEHFTLRHLLVIVAFLALIYGFTRDIDALVGVVITFVLGEVIQVFQKTPTIDDRWVQVGVGTFVTLGSIAWLGYELTVASSTGGLTWFPGLTALVGVWFLLDARKDFLDGSDDRPYDDMGANEVMVVMGHRRSRRRWVVRRTEDRRGTRRRL